MNNFRWITSLLNMGGRQSFLNMFGRKRNNRGVMWASLLGVVVSAAAAFFLRRNQDNNNMFQPIGEMVNNITRNNNNTNTLQSNTLFAEFSKELNPNNDLGNELDNK